MNKTEQFIDEMTDQVRIHGTIITPEELPAVQFFEHADIIVNSCRAHAGELLPQLLQQLDSASLLSFGPYSGYRTSHYTLFEALQCCGHGTTDHSWSISALGAAWARCVAVRLARTAPLHDLTPRERYLIGRYILLTADMHGNMQRRVERLADDEVDDDTVQFILAGLSRNSPPPWPEQI